MKKAGKLLFCMFALTGALYVAGQGWPRSESRRYRQEDMAAEGTERNRII